MRCFACDVLEFFEYAEWLFKGCDQVRPPNSPRLSCNHSLHKQHNFACCYYHTLYIYELITTFYNLTLTHTLSLSLIVAGRYQQGLFHEMHFWRFYKRWQTVLTLTGLLHQTLSLLPSKASVVSRHFLSLSLSLSLAHMYSSLTT